MDFFSERDVSVRKSNFSLRKHMKVQHLSSYSSQNWFDSGYDEINAGQTIALTLLESIIFMFCLNPLF